MYHTMWLLAKYSPLTILVGQSLLQFWDALSKRSPGISETCFLQTLSNISVAKGRVCKFFIMQGFFKKKSCQKKYYEVVRLHNKTFVTAKTLKKKNPLKGAEKSFKNLPKFSPLSRSRNRSIVFCLVK